MIWTLDSDLKTIFKYYKVIKLIITMNLFKQILSTLQMSAVSLIFIYSSNNNHKFPATKHSHPCCIITLGVLRFSLKNHNTKKYWNNDNIIKKKFRQIFTKKNLILNTRRENHVFFVFLHFWQTEVQNIYRIDAHR